MAAPVADAGEDQEITFPAGATMNGAATDAVAKDVFEVFVLDGQIESDALTAEQIHKIVARTFMCAGALVSLTPAV